MTLFVSASFWSKSLKGGAIVVKKFTTTSFISLQANVPDGGFLAGGQYVGGVAIRDGLTSKGGDLRQNCL